MNLKKIKDKPIYTAAQVPKTTFSTWRTTLKNPDADTLPDIAKVLDVSLEWLITGKETSRDSPELSPDDKKLLKFYHSANEEGKERILEQAEFLSQKHPSNLKNSNKESA